MKNLVFATAALLAASIPFATSAEETPFVAEFHSRHAALADSEATGRKPVKVVAKARKAVRTKGQAALSTRNERGAGGASSGRYGALIARYAAAYGVPVGLAHAVIRVESNYRANARGGAGEIGLMQIKPATARMLGYSGGAGGLFNPETNLKYGMMYLGKAHRLGGGSVCGTILKYNAGHGAKRMNPVSSAYCGKVKRYLKA